jgi:hypothetical protein
MEQRGKFVLMNREEFKTHLLNKVIKREITNIQNHHTAIPSYKDFKNNHFTLCQNMENYHMTQWKNPAKEIAQNYTTFPDGTIMLCRPLDTMPAGIARRNDGSVCFEHLGNFNRGGDVMTEEHRKTIISVNAVFCIKCKFKPTLDTMIYHRWFDGGGKRINDDTPLSTECPGTNFFGGHSTKSAQENFYPLIVEEMKKILAVILSEGVEKMFEDEQKISHWAKKAVKRVKETKIMVGDDRGNFNPKDKVTREMLAQVISNMLDYLGR